MFCFRLNRSRIHANARARGYYTHKKGNTATITTSSFHFYNFLLKQIFIHNKSPAIKSRVSLSALPTVLLLLYRQPPFSLLFLYLSLSLSVHQVTLEHFFLSSKLNNSIIQSRDFFFANCSGQAGVTRHRFSGPQSQQQREKKRKDCNCLQYIFLKELL